MNYIVLSSSPNSFMYTPGLAHQKLRFFLLFLCLTELAYEYGPKQKQLLCNTPKEVVGPPNRCS